MDTQFRLSKLTISLHWIIAFALIASLAFGMYLEELPRSPKKGELMGLHKSVGVAILLIAAFRVYWRAKNGLPKPLTPVEGMQKTLTHAVHYFLLAGTLFMPLSGILMSVGGGHPVPFFSIELIAAGEKIEWLGGLGKIVHGLGANLLIAAIVLHVAATFKHRLVTKDGTLERMLGKEINR